MMSDKETVPSESKDAVLEEAYVDEYWSAYRQHVHTLLAWGYTDSRHKVQADDEEPAITGFIAEAIQSRLNDPNSPDWCDTIDIHDDPPIPGGGRTGRGRWRPDLIFKSTERRPRPMYHFEAKRLREQGSGKEYLGADGLGCFLSGKYASESDEAGMLGYVQCDDVDIWVTRLQSAIEHSRLNENKLLILASPCNIQIIDSFPYEWMSKHNRDRGKPVMVHHILLDYCVP
jgi:hypothetical protein